MNELVKTFSLSAEEILTSIHGSEKTVNSNIPLKKTNSCPFFWTEGDVCYRKLKKTEAENTERRGFQPLLLHITS